MYFNGEFDAAYNQLKTLISNESLMAIDGKYKRGRVLERIVYHNAQNLYSMEGYVFNRALHDLKFDTYKYNVLGSTLVQIAMNVEPLLSLVEADQNYFEAQRYLHDAIDINQIDKSIQGLHDNEHLERVTLTYIKSRDVYISYEGIDKLVNVNPFTRGLKKLMYAFSYEHKCLAENSNTELHDKILSYYQSALPDLSHIKFYYAQALYFYARFLKQIGSQEFETVYERGLPLTLKHHYRYWQHRFLLLKQPNLGKYKPEDYPLPGNPDISSLIEKQAKWIKQKYGTSLHTFNQGGAESKALSS